MADTVRYLMEEMIPELEDLEKKGYFSKAEVKAVAQKRQDFEYALKRRAAMKRDFLRYIDYESKLEELRRHRKKQRGIKAKRGLAELGILRRIHFIYERATRKFKADLSLWITWLAYCKRSKSTKQFSKVVTKALHRHSHVAALWIEAAAWEFEQTANVAAARALMQRGLRHCPRDETLWAEYCRLELLYVARLRARRQVLGLPNPETPEELNVPANKVKRKRTQTAAEVADAGLSGAAAEGLNEEAAVRGVLTGAVVRAVIKGAAAASPESLSLRVRLLRVLAKFSFPGIEQLVDFVYADIEGRFCVTEDGWDVLARRHLPGGLDKQMAPHLPSLSGLASAQPDEGKGDSWEVDMEGHSQCCVTYRQGLERVPTCRMHEVFITYLGQRTRPLLVPAAAGEARAIEQLGVVGAQLLGAYQAVLKAGKATERLCAEWVDWALALGQPKVAVRASKAACEAFQGGVAVWLRRVRLELELHRRDQRTAEQLIEVLQLALAAIPAADGAELWQVALEAVPPGQQGHDALQKLLLMRLAGQAQGPVRGGLGPVVGVLVRSVRRTQGLAASRGLVDKLLVLPAAGGEWFHAALDVELEELGLLKVVLGTPSPVAESAPAKASEIKGAARDRGVALVQRLFEAAVGAYGKVDVGLWLRYAAFEQASGRGAGGVYWRATRTLEDPDAFVEHHREMMAAMHA